MLTIFPMFFEHVHKNLLHKNFLWHYFWSYHGPLRPHGPAQKKGIKSIFSNIFVWPLIGKTISSRFRKTLNTGSENAPERLQKSTKFKGLYIICAWRLHSLAVSTDFSVLHSLPCGEVSVHFLRMWVFFKLYILALYLKPSLHPQLKSPASNRTLKILHFISNYWNIMGKGF